jgi:hypothetical protein
MQITKPSSGTSLPVNSSNTSASPISTDKVLSNKVDGKPAPAAQVYISEIAQKAQQEDLPRYLKPVTGYVDPYAKSGSTFDYLKASDQTALREAYDYAIENGTSLEAVNEAAFYLGSQRLQERQIAGGTQYAFHVSEESIPFILAKPEKRAEELEKIATNFEPTFLNRLQRAEAGDFFGTDNPHLNQELFIDAVDQSLGPYRSDKIPADKPLIMPNTPSDSESLLLNHLSGSDKSALSKAYQNAKENNLDPEEVRKAALLLAVERMNENMSKSFSDNNSTAANAVKASSNMYQSIVDTPDKLIDLAQKVLGDDAAESFSNMVGQSRTEELFGRNSALRQALFLQPAYNLLNMMNKD